MPAFLAALNAGATHVETDARASSDEQAVLSHDPDLARVAGRDERVDQLTLAELRQVDLGHGQAFTTLTEALDAFPEARFNIDVKSVTAISPTIRAVTDAGATSRVLITSFSEACRSETVAGLPGVATSASTARVVPAVLGAWTGLSPVLRMALSGIDAMQIPATRRRLRIVTPRLVRAVHAAGVEVHVWTVNDPADMARLLDAGVDGLVTDRCDLARALVDARP